MYARRFKDSARNFVTVNVSSSAMPARISVLRQTLPQTSKCGYRRPIGALKGPRGLVLVASSLRERCPDTIRRGRQIEVIDTA
jgi:hypothetical protein